MRITLFLLLKIKESSAFKCENNQVSSNKWPLLQNEDWRLYNVLSLLSWQRSCTMRWGSIKGTWKSWQLASWLNLKCKKKLFQMMPKWPSFSWEVENYWKRWKFFKMFFISLWIFLSRKFNKLITNLHIVSSDLHLHLQQRNHSSKRHSSPLGTTHTFFFHAAFLNTSKPLTVFAASCIQLPNMKCLPDQIFHMKVFNILIFFAVLVLFQQIVLFLSEQGVGSMIKDEKCYFYMLNARSVSKL